jgi:membrane associated rhomboid family serine protease
MDLLWFLIGLIVGVGGTWMVLTQRDRLSGLDFVLLTLLAVLAVFTVAYIAAVAAEPQVGASRATAVGALIFGGVTVIYGVLLFRKIRGEFG